MRIFLMLFLAIQLLVACKPSGAGDQKANTDADPGALEANLMALHDSAMVKLNVIHRLSGQLRDIRAQFNEGDGGSGAYPAGLDKVLEDLKMADQAMWDWMKSYSDNKKTQTEEQLAAFYERETVKMTTVNNAIESSISNAKNWLTAHGTAPK